VQTAFPETVSSSRRQWTKNVPARIGHSGRVCPAGAGLALGAANPIWIRIKLHFSRKVKFSMSQAKRLIEQHDDNIAWAKGLLVRTGAVTKCEHHEELTDNYDPKAVEEAIKLAKKASARDLIADHAAELVREAVLDIGDECSGCAAWERD
jgi:hypothetical protein